jgi:hypothetical protein
MSEHTNIYIYRVLPDLLDALAMTDHQNGEDKFSILVDI